MKPDEIHLKDWVRIVFGEVPAEFYVELIIRSFLVYLILLVSMRIMGKRMSGQLSRLDLAAMVALASSIGISMLSPVNGILPPLIVAIIIVLISRLVSYLSIKSEKIEVITQGKLDTLVTNGVMNITAMKKVRVTRETLFAKLRSLKVTHLGKINRIYMEADGNFSMVPNSDEHPGLLLLPDWDQAFIKEKMVTTNLEICIICGEKKPDADKYSLEVRCSNCNAQKWTIAFLENKNSTTDLA